MSWEKFEKLLLPHCRKVLFLWLVITTLPILFFANIAVDEVQRALTAPTHVKVGDLAELPIAGGPATIVYNKTKGELWYPGLVDDEARKALAEPVRDLTDEHREAKGRYLEAVDRLAFIATQKQGKLTLLLLLLGGIAGALGVQLRSIVNFVGHACFANDLDAKLWWPYYAIRPITGFILGVALIAIVQAGFLSLPSTASHRVLWWAALAFLAGFGEEEFTQRLRSVSKSIFGDKAQAQRPPP